MASTFYLLSIALIAVIILLILIMKFKIHSFISLIIVSLFTAFATRIPTDKILEIILSGFGNTLASVALLVGLGAMIGKIIESSGGALVLANTLINKFGEDKAPLALGVASLIFAFPIFFDAGLIVMLPIIISIAKKLKANLLVYALPSIGAFSVMHIYLPPHPGPVAAAQLIGANIGYVVIVGLIIALITWYFSSYLFGTIVGAKFNIQIPTLFSDEEHLNIKPKFFTITCILLTPVILIFINATISSLIKLKIVQTNEFLNILLLIGQTQIALLITLILCIVIFYKDFGAKKLENLCEKSLPAICSVVLVTGAGGMFGSILKYSGIGQALADKLNELSIPILLASFLIAACIRIAQGSATVALTTTASLIAPTVLSLELSELQNVCIVLAIASGSVVCSHFNDSGFWLVKGLFNLDEKTTLKTWTILETLIGVIGFLLTSILYLFA